MTKGELLEALGPFMDEIEVNVDTKIGTDFREAIQSVNYEIGNGVGSVSLCTYQESKGRPDGTWERVK